MKLSTNAFVIGSIICVGLAAAFTPQAHTAAAGRKSQALPLAATIALDALKVDIDENAPRDVWAMDEYMTSCGVQRAEGLSLYESGTQASPDEYGLMTQTDLPAESPVLCVPSEMIFSSEELRQGELKGLVDAAEETLLVLGVTEKDFPMFHLFLKILIEHEKGDESPWFPWLNSLPRRYSNGASMTRA
eukprot:CAMPEP_0201233700 /NCGR_PEP_ID=MMETSP0852-20130820/5534_1 /ASSEMBLY_ACC=CAM_ASM_000632 /TAXON_ID=183588 /ORGANISM="Pseudo-nitzschia fraudulenta, Strain WWA7" /LENGTH=188 /DNA_ID=CAMNT_0047526709 /DNA_START=92 /DNA_END=658 /DNA_ORIENTATION=+